MRAYITPFVLLVGLALPAGAQDIGGLAEGNGGNAALPGGQETCVEVQVGGERAFRCLNEKLKRAADEVNPALNLAPINEKSPDPALGIANVPSLRQQYGRNFGVSVIPHRPPPLVYSGSLRRP
ncbi:MAG: hypothetical protein WC807_19395 [Hyphomicrobium sp.]|jgi:hypothetical protein